MHPTGLEPASKASEAYVLSIRLRVHMLQICYIAFYDITYFLCCPAKSIRKFLLALQAIRIKIADRLKPRYCYKMLILSETLS